MNSTDFKKMIIKVFVEDLKEKGYVIASVSNDPECEQELHECSYVDQLIDDFGGDV